MNNDTEIVLGQSTEKAQSSTSMDTLTYADVITEHQQLDIDFDQTIALIHQLFPDCISEAIALWNVYEARKLGAIEQDSFIQSALIKKNF